MLVAVAEMIGIDLREKPQFHNFGGATSAMAGLGGPAYWLNNWI